MNFVSIDFEKLNDSQTSVCEVGMVKYQNGIECDSFHSYIKPLTGLTRNFWAKKNLQHISDETLSSAPTFPEVYYEMKNFIGDNVLVCHGVGADINYIYSCEQVLGLSELYSNGYIDTCEPLGKSSIDKIYHDTFNIMMENHHKAIDDARACGVLLCNYMKTNSVRSYVHYEQYIPSKLRETSHTTQFGTNIVEPDGLIITDISDLANKKKGLFSCKRVVISGVSDDEKLLLKNLLIENYNSKVVSSINSSTNVLIIGDKMGPSKRLQAIDLQKDSEKNFTVIKYENALEFVTRFTEPTSFFDAETEVEENEFAEICMSDKVAAECIPDFWERCKFYAGLKDKEIKALRKRSLNQELLHISEDLPENGEFIIIGKELTDEEVSKIIDDQIGEAGATLVFDYSEIINL